MFKVVTPDNFHKIMQEIKKKSKSYVMNYNDIQRFIQEKNMNDVELVPMNNVCLSEDLRFQLMEDISEGKSELKLFIIWDGGLSLICVSKKQYVKREEELRR